MDMQLAEPGTKRLLLFDRELLVPKEDDEIFHQRSMDFVELPVTQSLREIDAKDLGTDRWSCFAYLDSFVNHIRLQFGQVVRWFRERWWRTCGREARSSGWHLRPLADANHRAGIKQASTGAARPQAVAMMWGT